MQSHISKICKAVNEKQSSSRVYFPIHCTPWVNKYVWIFERKTERKGGSEEGRKEKSKKGINKLIKGRNNNVPTKYFLNVNQVLLFLR